MRLNLYLLIPVLFVLLTISAVAQNEKTQSNDECQIKLKEIDQLVNQTTSFFKQNDFNQAYSSAKKASALADKFCPGEEEKRLSLVMNVAEIQLKREKFDEARIIFENNLNLAEAVYGETSGKFNTYLNYLLKLAQDKISNEKFEQYFLKSLRVKEAYFGAESPELMDELVKVAKYFEYLKEFEKSEEYYLRAIEINLKLLSQKKSTDSHPMNSYRFFLIKQFGAEGRKKSDELAQKWSLIASENDEKPIMNGRAIKTSIPAYPLTARSVGASGEVLVEITIDEDGKVIEANAISGNQLLHISSVEAAKKWEFLPTFLDGKPVKVKGIITFIYN